MDRTYLGGLLKPRLLAPEIITMIFKGHSPMHLNASKLMRTNFPRCWERQREVFGLDWVVWSHANVYRYI